MSVLRTWACDDCGLQFDSWSDDPECPGCALAERRKVITPVNIGSERTKRKDASAKRFMDEGNLTDMKDNLREGDTMAKIRPDLQKLADNYFQPQTSKDLNLNPMLASLNGLSEAERSQPMDMLANLGKQGKI